MNQGKIRILGIAPYEGMKSIMLKLAKDRDDIDLSVFVGDLHKGAEIAGRISMKTSILLYRGAARLN